MLVALKSEFSLGCVELRDSVVLAVESGIWGIGRSFLSLKVVLYPSMQSHHVGCSPGIASSANNSVIAQIYVYLVRARILSRAT